MKSNFGLLLALTLIAPGFAAEKPPVEVTVKLRALSLGPLTNPDHYLTFIAKGDEVLDWREMLARHQAGQVCLIEGSDHALSDFEDHLPQILEFLQLV